jgi:hypothetical protein
MTENEKTPFSVIYGKRFIYGFPFRQCVPRSGRAEKPALPNSETRSAKTRCAGLFIEKRRRL